MTTQVTVRSVEALDGTRLRLTFSDGVVGEVEVDPQNPGPMFERYSDRSVEVGRASALSETLKTMLAELVGTFWFFVIGAGAVVITTVTDGGLDLLGVAFAHGVALALAVSVFGRISGGHFNPAVTVAMWVTGKIDAVTAARYVVAQLLGSVLAGVVLLVFFARTEWEPTHLGTPALAAGVSGVKGVLIEAVLTFFLLIAIWGTAVDARAPKIAGFGIGLTVFTDILAGGPLTGAAMNPARWFGPAVASGFFDDWWVYLVGPVVGAIAASLLFKAVFSSVDEVAP